MTSHDRTLDHYQELMTINATAHVLRTARDLRLFDRLSEGQKTLEQLAELMTVPRERLQPLLLTLRAIGIIECYGEDYAISSTARLLCQYDRDLGDHVWNRLTDTLRQPCVDPDQSSPLPKARFESIAATQWVHTPAAIQAAEMLDLGKQNDAAEIAQAPIELLDYGCGSAVWSCAIAHRQPRVRVTAVDCVGALQSAHATAASIDLLSRYEFQESEGLDASLPNGQYDVVLVAQRLHSLVPAQIDDLLVRLSGSLKKDGRLIVIDAFAGPARPSLAESLETLRLMVDTIAAQTPTLAVAQARLERAGLSEIQFTYIAASRIGLGMMVGSKP